jgi:hypothetical protein
MGVKTEKKFRWLKPTAIDGNKKAADKQRLNINR